ncbi:MAG: UDP-galactopyranose mutase [Snowella sp.]|nr:UDP-galactopyranose mutase [Snowella sp.]
MKSQKSESTNHRFTSITLSSVSEKKLDEGNERQTSGISSPTSHNVLKATHLNSNSPDIVCLSHLRWNFVFQRPQHLLSRCSQERRVFFVEEPIFKPEPGGRLDISNDQCGVTVVVPYLLQGMAQEEINAALEGLLSDLLVDYQIHHYICWYYTPLAIAFTRHLQPQAVIYDCMDELSAFKGASPQLKEYEAELFRRANLVFTGGQSLYESKVNRHPHVYAFPSSVDVAHFSQARKVEEPTDQADIPHPRLGFFGVIDERMDLELLQGVAEARPDWHLVILGPVVKIDPATLPQCDNIHYLGSKSYQDLPKYLAGWDLALLPFARNESTRYISPTKTPEYLAAAKPVVSTSIRDVVRPYQELNLVRIADTVEEFVTAAEKAMQEDTPTSGWLDRVDAFLNKLSWDRTLASMIKLIDSAIATEQAENSLKGHSNGKNNGKPENLSNGKGSSTAIADRPAPISSGIQAPSIAKKDFVFDYLVVGAGFSGCVIAERLARQLGKKILVIDKRNHIGGNAYDHYNDDGILVHKYGPHIFHTNSREVFEYLSRFTQWRAYEHRVLASVDGQLVPIPINLDTINKLYGMKLNSFEVEAFYKSLAEPTDYIRTSEDVVISKVGRTLYEKFFRNYTRKQWGLDPSELDKSVIARIPTRTNRDDRYFTDSYQAMPLYGFTRLFENMLNHPHIKVMLNTDYREVEQAIPCREMVYTGPVDEFFDYRYGKLPYRSLDFKHETHNVSIYQPAPVINYPNEHLYTRVTEFKYLTGQEHNKTSIVYEFPKAEGDPYYPIPRPENQEVYKQYKELADATSGVHFVGRLATYKYYNMDQCVAQALSVYKQIAVKA